MTKNNTQKHTDSENKENTLTTPNSPNFLPNNSEGKIINEEFESLEPFPFDRVNPKTPPNSPNSLPSNSGGVISDLELLTSQTPSGSPFKAFIVYNISSNRDSFRM